MAGRLEVATRRSSAPVRATETVHTTANCLAVLEPAVDWEAEKLYGEDGLGPFDEF
jgi:hypothetical protein